MASRRTKSELIFIVGGASSGKSDVALQVAAQGMGQQAPRAFVATGEGLDEEMAMKIARHQQARSSEWVTAEVPLQLTAWFKDQGRSYQIIVVDCLTMWLSNHCERGTKERDILEEMRTLLRTIRRNGGRVVFVSNELGLGLVPAEAPSRRFRELAGELNRLVAQEADVAYFVVSGLPLPLKERTS
ncbi:MAG TPA: bifunctional adenosylcobinamide kinase/adenosylcobinamide-phosphate guanylyltransferase [Nitrospira sp.]|nr:bifunctional adenosylcobinamide kinase/adenosylcobinamide-phosphate guanylyltransferase [Nitrospira sp.]